MDSPVSCGFIPSGFSWAGPTGPSTVAADPEGPKTVGVCLRRHCGIAPIETERRPWLLLLWWLAGRARHGLRVEAADLLVVGAAVKKKAERS